ncbi:MAG: septum site-determining protein MinC [Firmicutes bacterium]|nr:septum site-determining protein MinC [Bacillota bacterium]
MGNELVSIKGTRNGLLIVLDPNREFEEIRNTLLRKMESARGFFKGAKFSFFQGQRDIPAHQKNELENICRQFGLVPQPKEQTMASTPLAETFRSRTHAASLCATEESAVLVRRSLRSGQRISHPGHIIVLGDVHPGAELVSGGNVLVMGNCRGVVHAGVEGDCSAKVIAWRLAPTVVSIAGRRFAPEQALNIPEGSRMARLSGQEVIFEPYQAGK